MVSMAWQNIFAFTICFQCINPNSKLLISNLKAVYKRIPQATSRWASECFFHMDLKVKIMQIVI